MIYGLILAGGIGKRMGDITKPKQFMNIADKPIIIHTVEKFMLFDEMEEIIVLCPKEWVEHTKSLIKKHLNGSKNIVVIEGGITRNETIMNGIDYIDGKGNLEDDTIIVTHDAVRPFVTYRMIKENIEVAKECGACDTVIKATDTIVESSDGKVLSDIPDREKFYQGQTPQSFNAKKLRELYNALSDREKEILTDACKIFVLSGEKVRMVDGETFNIKITYPYDIAVAESLMGGIL